MLANVGGGENQLCVRRWWSESPAADGGDGAAEWWWRREELLRACGGVDCGDLEFRIRVNFTL